MSRAWKLAVGATLGAAKATSPINSTLRKIANKLPPNERVRVAEKKSTRPPNAKFTDSQVRIIRKAQKILTYAEIGELVGMDALCIQRICEFVNYSKVL